jgi:hypothetical protein
MSTCFSDRLDETLVQLKTQGFEIVRILADASAIERIFRERGETAILMDCDDKRDVAWYLGEFELEASSEPGASVRYVDAGRTLYAAIEGDPPLDPSQDEPAEEPHRAAA